MILFDENQNPGSRFFERVYSQRPLGETLHPGGVTLTQKALSQCNLPSGAKVLDLGCGPGKSLQYLQSNGFQAIGLDLSRCLLLQSGKVAASSLHVQADGLCIPFEKNAVGAVITECTLSLFPDTYRVLAELHRILSPDGVLVISDLYTRNPSALPEVKQLFPQSCLGHAFVQEVLMDGLFQNGFFQKSWEDHSEILKSLSGGSILTSFTCSPQCKVDAMDALLAVTRAKIGYFVCIAQKQVAS